MWVLQPENETIAPVSDTTPPLAILQPSNEGLAPLAVCNQQSQYTESELVEPGFDPTTVVATIPAPVGNEITVDLSASVLQDVDAVAAGDLVFTPAEDPDNPVAGEFTFDPDTGSLVVTIGDGYTPTTGLSFSILARLEVAHGNTAPSSLLAAFVNSPIQGVFSWRLSIEQHPTGTLRLWVDGSLVSIVSIRNQFKIGTEFRVADIGFAVGSYQEKLTDTKQIISKLYEVTISLNGKWEAPQFNQPVRLNPQGDSITESGTAQDPACLLGGSGSGSPVTQTAREYINIDELARQTGVTIQTISLGGQNIDLNNGNVRPQWGVEVPPDTPNNISTAWASELPQLLRANGTFVDYTNFAQVRTPQIDSVRSWAYSLDAYSLSVNGSTENSPDWKGYGFEYPNVQVSGNFSEEAIDPGLEDDSISSTINGAIPNWITRDPIRQTIVIDPDDAITVPGEAFRIKSVTVNASLTGPTKQLIIRETEDGFPISEETTIYGFRFSTDEAFVLDGNGRVDITSPALFWRIIEKTNTTYIYDDYGYLTRINTTGYRWLRATEETDAALEASNASAIELPQYRYRQVPIRAGQQFLYHQHYDYYEDAQEQDRGILFKYCNRDGTSSLGFSKDPTWAPSVFLKESLSFETAYLEISNPDNAGLGPSDDLVPNLITGKEFQTRTKVDVLPSRSTGVSITQQLPEPPSGYRELISKVSRGSNETPDRYIEYLSNDATMNAQFNDKALDVQSNEVEGRPAPAQRKPPTEILEPPEPDTKINGQTDEDDEAEVFYTLTTPGYTTEDPIGGSISFSPNAIGEDRITTAAETELKIGDIKRSISFTYEVPPNYQMRPMDRVRISGTETFMTRVVDIQNQIVIEGNGIFRSTPTQVNAGIDRDITLTLNKQEIPRPRDGNGDLINVLLYRIAGLEIGSIRPPFLRSRLNPEGES